MEQEFFPFGLLALTRGIFQPLPYCPYVIGESRRHCWHTDSLLSIWSPQRPNRPTKIVRGCLTIRRLKTRGFRHLPNGVFCENIGVFTKKTKNGIVETLILKHLISKQPLTVHRKTRCRSMHLPILREAIRLPNLSATRRLFQSRLHLFLCTKHSIFFTLPFTRVLEKCVNANNPQGKISFLKLSVEIIVRQDWDRLGAPAAEVGGEEE